jgi:hypothetical protein
VALAACLSVLLRRATTGTATFAAGAGVASATLVTLIALVTLVTALVAIVAVAAVALRTCLAGFFRCELVGVAAGVGCTATFSGNFTLAIAVHRCKAALGLSALVACAVLTVLVVASGISHLTLLFS